MEWSVQDNTFMYAIQIKTSDQNSWRTYRVYNHYIYAFIASLYYTQRYKISCLLNNIVSSKTRIVKFDEHDFTDWSNGCNFFKDKEIS